MILSVIPKIALGAFVGGVIGAIVTQDWIYTMVWAVAIPVFIFSALARESRRKGASSEAPATTSDPAARTPETRSSVTGTVISLSIAALVAALVLIPAYSSIGRAAVSVGTGRWDGTNLQTGIFQQDAVAAIFAAAGHTQFENLYFYDSYIIADGLTTPTASTVDTYQYRYGRAWRDGPAFSQPDVLENVIFDASTIDFTNVGVAVRDARERANLVGTVSILAYVARPYVSGDDAEPQPPLIYVSLSGDYADASYEYTLDGKIIG